MDTENRPILPPDESPEDPSPRRPSSAPLSPSDAVTGQTSTVHSDTAHSESNSSQARNVRAGDAEDSLVVVGIGASAGGLTALRTFFASMPHDTGMVFVVVVHLSPEHESILAELLQGYTLMPVSQVQSRVQMQPDHVYVIPPGKRLLVAEGHLDLAEFEMPHGRRLQIDTFLRSLAEQHGDGAAIILSGSGSDGAVGIQSIKQEGGLILVQQPEEAEYDGMPKSAIATGLVDIVAPVGELAGQLVAAKQTRASLELPDDPDQLALAAQQTLSQILAQLRMRTGHDFTGYKRTSILRRIARRMQLVQIDTLSGYLNRLRQADEEIDALYRDLLIHVTQFFRDSSSWSYLEEKVIPRIFEGKREIDSVRVWTVGCATGEEAYGIAMLLMEHAATLAAPPNIQIFASDLGRLVLDFAREGSYPEAIAADVPEERLRRFFVKDNSHYRVRAEVRERVLFAPHNLLQDPPFSKLDLILCRNLLIYLQRPMQERVFDAFFYALRPTGYLFLGSAESPEGVTQLFDTVSKQHRVYQRSERHKDDLVLPSLSLLPRAMRGKLAPSDESDTYEQEDSEQHRILLEEVGLPSLLINSNHEVLHYSESAGRYLQHPAGPPTNDVTRLVRSELQTEVRLALTRAFTQKRATRTMPVPVQFNGAPHPVTVFVRPTPYRGRMLLLFWEDEDATLDADGGAQVPRSKRRSDELQAELRVTQQRLQATREEYETTVEELRAANEELQSTNEEYRSTLEELETSKEELQSINEELQSVNQEMRSRVDEVTKANSDLQNLFAATEIATLFLDRELHVKRYTPRAAQLFNLMPPDRGRPISHLRINLVYTTLEADARQVLDTLIPVEREVDDEQGNCYRLSVRPYRTTEDKIGGVVITCVDISQNKRVERELRDAKEYAESIITTIPDPLIVLDTQLRVKDVNDAFYQTFAVQPETTVGRLVYELGNGQWSIPELRELLERILPKDEEITGYEVTHNFDGIGERTMLLNARRLDHVQLILLAITDITQRKRAQEALRQSEERLRVTMESITDHAIISLDAMGTITGWNTGAEHIFGYSAAEAIGQPSGIIFTPEDRAHGIDEEELQVARTTGRSVDERWHQRKDGSRIFLSGTLVPLRNESKTGFVKIARDLTERRQMEEQLESTVQERTTQVRNLVIQLTMSEQEERRRISSILHDDLQQRLFGAIFQLHTVRDAVRSDPDDVRGLVSEIEEALQTSVRIARELSVDLSPPVLHDEGLVEALRWLAHRMHQQYSLDVTLQADETVPLSNENLRVLLFQIVRELLFNVVKHAGVDAAIVTVSRTDHHVQIDVRDEGSGFVVDETTVNSGDSQGLPRIKQRLQLLGGHLEIESAPGAGTRIVLVSPL